MQQLSVITLGTDDLARSLTFYRDGFGWTPVFSNEEIAFYQMNGFVLGTWLTSELAKDSGRPDLRFPAAFALAHNVASEGAVDELIATLVKAGGKLLRPADAPLHGGYRGYVADPDDHAWEIAFNPAWTIDTEGRVTFGV
jgi:catechol 2,3-dioxygenase-like lactoylglutathione lyase family enzyme